MFQKCLLILTSPLATLQTRLSSVLGAVSRIVTGTVYIYVQPQKNDADRFQLRSIPCTSDVLTFIRKLYTCSETGGFVTSKLSDVKVLLGHISNKTSVISEYPIEGYNAIFIDSDTFSQFGVDRVSSLQYLLSQFPGAAPDVVVQLVRELQRAYVADPQNADITEQDSFDAKPSPPTQLQTYDEVVLGGTFDHFHVGHKILLSEACVRCDRRLTVGVSDGAMNDRKVLRELMEPLKKRLQYVEDFIHDVKPYIAANVVTIRDPYGPTILEEQLQCLVVSEETRKGGEAVNVERARRGMAPLDQVVIDLVADHNAGWNEEDKVSSSSMRKRLLGSLLRPVRSFHGDPFPKRPYRIGLTGGIASGKSSVCRTLEELGAGVVNCDQLGHQAYVPGSNPYNAIVNTFGGGVLNERHEIDRAKLGAIVFSDKNKLHQLNKIVWPRILHLAEEEVQKYGDSGKDVVVLDAAVLLEAGWDRHVHEVWTTVIPKDESVKRLMDRNRLSEEEALKRVDSQLTNDERIAKANVVLGTLWDPEYRDMQTEKAWIFLTSRLP